MGLTLWFQDEDEMREARSLLHKEIGIRVSWQYDAINQSVCVCGLTLDERTALAELYPRHGFIWGGE